MKRVTRGAVFVLLTTLALCGSVYSGTPATATRPALPAGTQPAQAEPKRIVFVCDATGTMLGERFELQKRELLKAIDGLPPGSAFNVVFFRGGESDEEWAVAFNDDHLVDAKTTKDDARQFIEKVEIVGKPTNPLPALKLAFSQRPRTIFLLTDGQFDNVVSYEQVLAEVRRLNREKSVALHTIAFMSHDEKAEIALETLARENGGHFRKVSEKELKELEPF